MHIRIKSITPKTNEFLLTNKIERIKKAIPINTDTQNAYWYRVILDFNKACIRKGSKKNNPKVTMHRSVAIIKFSLIFL